MAGAKELTARQRARAAQSKRLAAQAARNRLLEDLYAGAFVALAGVAAARAAVEAAELGLAGALAALGAEGETQQAVGETLELPAEEVRRLMRAGRQPAITAAAG
jgi:uncharacterized protein YciI